MASGLRVAIFSDAQPGRNGVGTYYRDLATNLRPLTGGVELFSPGSGDPPLPHWLSLPLPGDRTQRLNMPSPIALRSRLRRSRPDVIVAATPGPYGLLAMQHARTAGTRLVFGLHTDYEALSSLYWGGVFGRVNRWGLAAIHRRLVLSADCVVAISPVMQHLGQRAGRNDVHLLGTQLAAAFVATPTTVPADELRRVIYVGRLANEKCLPRVIDAASRLRHVEFRIAGDGPLRADVEHAAARLPNVHYLGWLPREDIRAAIDASDLLVLPSAVEAFGTVALEALARQRVALVAAGCGIHGWSELGPGLFRLDEGADLAATIERVAAVSPAARRQAAREGRVVAQAMHEAALARWLAVLQGDCELAAAA